MEQRYRKRWWQHYLALLSGSVLPLLLFTFVLSAWWEQSAVRHIHASLRDQAESRRDLLDLFFNEHLNQLSVLASGSTLPELDNERNLNKILGGLRSTSQAHLALWTLGADGTLLAAAGPPELTGSKAFDPQAAWFAAATAQGRSVSDLRAGPSGSPYCFVAVRISRAGRPEILVAALNLDSFEPMVHKAWTGRLGDAYLVNQDQRLQTRPRFGGDLGAQPAAPPGAASMLAAALTSSGSTTTMARLGRDGEVLLTAAALRQVSWQLILTQNAEEVLAPLLQRLFWLRVLALLVAALLATVAIFATHALINRIQVADRESAACADMLLQGNKMIALSKVAAGIAHEVNNPLAAIAEKAGWLKDLLAEEDIAASPNFVEFSESVDKIEQHVIRARNIILNLLGFARRMEPARETFDIPTLLNETIGFLENESRYAGIHIVKTFTDGLPQITSDRSQIQQVVLNLLNNAIDAIGRDGTITVITRHDEASGMVAIDVADTGKGIAPADLDNIFQPFFTTKAVGKGTGLGLSISHGIIEKLGGRLTVQSKVGQGTVFTLLLPKQ